MTIDQIEAVLNVFERRLREAEEKIEKANEVLNIGGTVQISQIQELMVALRKAGI